MVVLYVFPDYQTIFLRLIDNSLFLTFTGVPDGPNPVGGCYDFDGTFYSEGESWHPTLPGQGQVTCINCTCIVSNITTIVMSAYGRLTFVCLPCMHAKLATPQRISTLNVACPFMIPHAHTSPQIDIPSHNTLIGWQVTLSEVTVSTRAHMWP